MSVIHNDLTIHSILHLYLNYNFLFFGWEKGEEN